MTLTLCACIISKLALCRSCYSVFFFSSRRRHTRCALVTGVQTCALPISSMSDALIATGIPFQGAGDPQEWTRIYNALGPQVAGIRRFGSASLDLAWLAAGRFDGFWESGLSDWDTAAGCLLVREAGGFVTDYRGRSKPILAREVLAANNVLHSKLHKSVVGALKG